MSPSSIAVKRLFSAAFQTRAYSAPAERAIPQAKQKYIPTTGSYPKGFLAGSSHAGVKDSNTQYDDIALVASETPCPAAAVFTRNVFKAAPVHVSKSILSEQGEQKHFRGVVVNSGCANAITGSLGREHAMRMAQVSDRCFGAEPGQESAPQTLVMSTGVIGKRLPISKIESAIPKAHVALGASHEDWMKAARAICTTDTFPKLLSQTFTLPSHPGTTYSIAGMTKGAGMIHPNMGTLLGIICTDAAVAPASLQRALTLANQASFNSISIDGDTSTNDTVMLFANGAAAPAGTAPLTLPTAVVEEEEGGPEQATVLDEDMQAFLNVLRPFMVSLAQLVVRDGEGATKFVTIRVQSDISFAVAKSAAASIATSALVKTALYGKDANWGRVLCAIGYAPGIMQTSYLPNAWVDEQGDEEVDVTLTTFDEGDVELKRTSVSFVPADGSEELKLLDDGEPEEVDEVRAKEILEMEDLEILVRLGGRRKEEVESDKEETHEAVFWTCDFSHEYVTINGDYRT